MTIPDVELLGAEPIHLCLEIATDDAGTWVTAVCRKEVFEKLFGINAIIHRAKTRLNFEAGRATGTAQYYKAFVPGDLLEPGLRFEAVDIDGNERSIWTAGSDAIALPGGWRFSRHHLMLEFGPVLPAADAFRCFFREFYAKSGALQVRLAVFAQDIGVLKDAKLALFRFRSDHDVKEFPLAFSAPETAFGIPASLYGKFSDRSVFFADIDVPLADAFDRSALYSMMLRVGGSLRGVYPFAPFYSGQNSILDWKGESEVFLLHHFSDPVSRNIRLEAFRFSGERAQEAKAVLDAGAWDGQDPVWLIGEYPNTARDNGWALFQHMRNSNPSIDAKYVISDPNLDRIEPDGKFVLEYGSVAHLQACMRTQAVLFTHHAAYVYPDMMRKLGEARGVKPITHFLQHGVLAIKPMLAAYEKSKHDYDIFNVSSTREQELVVALCKWERDDVVVAGLPRWDALRERNDKFLASGHKPSRILIFPTWRTSLDKLPESGFLESAFFRNWTQAIRRIVRIASEQDVEVDFCSHSIFQRFDGAFSDLGAKNVSMHEAIRRLPEYAALVTDYSSLCFDFLFLDKPSVFFMFDRDEFFAKNQAYIDVTRDLPGPVALSPSDLDMVVPAVLKGDAPAVDRSKFVRFGGGNSERVVRATATKIIAHGFADIEAATKTGDDKAVIRIAAACKGFTDPSDLLGGDFFRIQRAALDVLLNKGLVSECAAALRRIELACGAQSFLAPVKARLYLIDGDTESAARAIDYSFTGMHVPEQAADSRTLILLKAEVLLKRGNGARARELLTDNILELDASRVFELLRQSISRPEEIAEFENIILPRLLKLGPGILHALFNYSVLLRDFSDIERAISVARERFVAMATRRNFGSMPEDNRCWTKDAEVAIADLKEKLDVSGIEFFLSGQLLLSSERNEGLFGSDRKIDVGVSEETSLGAVDDALANSQFSLQGAPAKNVLRVRHPNGLEIAIFRFYKHDGQIFHEDGDAVWRNTPFVPTKRALFGGTYLVPEKADVFLTENFGDWRARDFVFAQFLNRPNMEARNPKQLAWHYLLDLADNFVRGSFVEFKRTWNALTELRPPEPSLVGLANDIIADVGKYRPAPPSSANKVLRARGQVVEEERLPGLIGAPVGVRADALPVFLHSVFSLLRLPVNHDALFLEARKQYQMLLTQPDNAQIRQKFEQAALRAGHAKIRAARYEEACQVLQSLRRVSVNNEKANRNLMIASLKGARQAEAARNKPAALQFWRYLKEVQPQSEAALQGIARCTRF